MKNIYLIILSFFVFPIFINAQSAYYDALVLKTMHYKYSKITSGIEFQLDSTNISRFYNVIKTYLSKNDTVQIYYQCKGFKNSCVASELGKLLNNYQNPFFSVSTTSKDFKGLGIGNIQLSSASKLASFGGINVTNYASALANVMIDHAKKELTVAFFNRFKKFVEDNPEFNVLFPKTANNIENLLAYKYTEMLPALRSSFFDDLNQLTFRLGDVLEMPRYRELLKKFPEIRVAIRSLNLIQQIESGVYNAADVIDEFAKFTDWTDSTASIDFLNMGNTIKLAAVFSQSLRDTSKDTIWISPKQVRQLVLNDTLFRIYLGLIYQQVELKNIEYRFVENGSLKTQKFTAIMKENIDNIEIFRNKVEEFNRLAHKVDVTYREIKAKGNKTNDDYYNYINISLDVIDYSFSIAQLFNEKIDGSDYMFIARQSNNLYRDIYNQQYTQAIIDATDIILRVYDLVYEKTGDPQKIELDNLVDFIQKAKPYALFMASAVVAKTPEEIQSAIENAVLPVGSSSVKKNSIFNISVQSYLGAYYQLNEASKINTSWNDQFGFHGPIGVSINWGFGKAGSASLFISFFDLGAIIDYKLTRDSVMTSNGQKTAEFRKESEIRLGQIASPGFFVVYGAPFNIPLSVGIGTQYGPGLSEINTGGAPVINTPKWRPCAFLSVDIPFITILNRAKGYKK